MATSNAFPRGLQTTRAAPWARSWWVDDHLIAGAYPGSKDLGQAKAKVGALVEAGVTLFVDLTTEKDHLRAYEPLIALADGSGSVRRRAVPVADLHPPSAADVQRVLGLIDEEAAVGGITYVHCLGGIGRTGSIVGCYLARDVGGDAALDELIDLRRRSSDAARMAPETSAQQALVRGWDRRPLSRRGFAINPVAVTVAATEIGLPLVRGALSLFPLFNDLPSAAAYVSGPEAAHAGVLHADELKTGAVVGVLEVRNDASVAMLLIDGETLLGADQNRCLDVSVLCPPESVTPVTVSCVEAGRWGSHRAMARSSRHTPGAMRSRNRSAVASAVRAGDEPRGDQGGVWADVNAYMQRVEAQAPTAAMEDVYVAASAEVAALIGDSSPLAGQRGVAAFVGEDLLALDLFDNPGSMAAYWEGLVNGYALDAIGRPPASVRRRQVRALFSAIAAAPIVRSLGKGIGESLHVTSDTVTATALCRSGVLVHLAAGPSADKTS